MQSFFRHLDTWQGSGLKEEALEIQCRILKIMMKFTSAPCI